MATGDVNAPETHEAGRFGGTNPRDLDQEGSRRNRSRLGSGGQLRLPAEYADFIMEDGRRLEDVLGKSFFAGFGKRGPRGRGKGRNHDSVRARMLAERRAQARRLNHTNATLTGAQGVAGAANTFSSKLSGG